MTSSRRVRRKSPQISTREPIIQEPAAHQQPTGPDDESEATRRDADVTESSRANRGWWDRNADEYQVEHGTFLGDDRFVWGPEGLDEVEAELLGPSEDLKGKDVLEIGSRRGPVRALAGRAGRPPGRPRHLPPPAPARPAHRHVLPAGVRRRGRAALRGRLLRPGVLGVRRDAVRRRPGAGPEGRAPRPAPGRPFRLLGHAPDPLGLPGRAGPRGPDRLRLLLRPHALRRAGRQRPRGVRRAPPHDRRPGARRGRRMASAWSTWSSRSGPPGTPRSGAAGPRCAGTSSPARRSSSANGTDVRRPSGGRTTLGA